MTISRDNTSEFWSRSQPKRKLGRLEVADHVLDSVERWIGSGTQDALVKSSLRLLNERLGTMDDSDSSVMTVKTRFRIAELDHRLDRRIFGDDMHALNFGLTQASHLLKEGKLEGRQAYHVVNRINATLNDPMALRKLSLSGLTPSGTLGRPDNLLRIQFRQLEHCMDAGFDIANPDDALMYCSYHARLARLLTLSGTPDLYDLEAAMEHGASVSQYLEPVTAAVLTIDRLSVANSVGLEYEVPDYSAHSDPAVRLRYFRVKAQTLFLRGMKDEAFALLGKDQQLHAETRRNWLPSHWMPYEWRDELTRLQGRYGARVPDSCTGRTGRP